MKISDIIPQPLQSSKKKRRLSDCYGCGGATDGRHIDRELLKGAKTDDEVQREKP